jgi:hypothetical protein
VGVLTWLPRFGFVDPQGPTRYGSIAQAADSGFRLPHIGHNDKAEAPQPTSVAIRDQLDSFDFPIGFKELTNVVGGGGEGDVSNIDIHALFLLRVGHQRQHIQDVE